ncbi:MAG: cysteine hydrolase [Methylocystaceae bacterium]|nr:cysteine hydrolase [Methylocystaceae bacterium]
MKLDATTALVVIDVQNAIDDERWEGKNHPDYISRIQDLLSIWRGRNWPIFHIKHNSADPDSSYFVDGPGNDFKDQAQPLPGEIVIEKTQNCAFIKTSLGSMLRMEGAEKLLVCGVVTQHSVDATVRHAAGLGFETYVMSDACTATPVSDKNGRLWDAADVHALTLGILDGEYCQVMTMGDIFAAI